MTEPDEGNTRKTIMVVDDEEDICDIVSEMLDIDGYNVMTASSGEECLKILGEGNKPDLILLDIMMGGIDGWETLRRIKGDKRMAGIPVSMLTVKPLTPETLKKEKIDYIENYIVKPFAMRELLSKIGEILGMEDHVRKVMMELISRNLHDTARQYEMYAKMVSRHTKLIRVLNKCAVTSTEEKEENLKRVLALEEKLVAINRKRLNEIEERHGISPFNIPTA